MSSRCRSRCRGVLPGSFGGRVAECPGGGVEREFRGPAWLLSHRIGQCIAVGVGGVDRSADRAGARVRVADIGLAHDLHCWEMSFNWVPTGIYRGFKFELRIKAPQLQDIKVTKQTNYRGVF